MLCLLERFELAADKELQVIEGIHRDPHYILIKKNTFFSQYQYQYLDFFLFTFIFVSSLPFSGWILQGIQQNSLSVPSLS